MGLGVLINCALWLEGTRKYAYAAAYLP